MKKLMAIGLSMVLAVTTIVGCSQKTPQPTSDASGKQKTSFSLSLRSGNIQYSDNHPNINEDKWVKKMEELANVDIDLRIVPQKDFDQKMTQMFATNDIPDVVQVGGSLTDKALSGSVQAGVFLPLNDLLEKHGPNLLKKIPKAAWAFVTDQKGAIYAIPEWVSNPARRGTWIRTDLLEKTGLPEPKTVEEYLNVLRAFKKLGVEHPFMGREYFHYSDLFFGSYDTYGNFFQKKGDQIVPNFTNVENMQKTLQTYKTMIDEGLMSQEFATINPTKFRNDIIAGKAGMWNMNANLKIQWEKQLQENVPTAKVKLITSPTGTDGMGGSRLVNPVVRGYFINKNAKDPVGIIKFFDWMLSDEAEKFFTYGIEGENYTVENGKINYKFPTTPAETDEETFRQILLWFVQDTTYNKGVLSLTPEGQDLMKVYDTVLSKEGRDGITFEPQLSTLLSNPDLLPTGDKLPPLILNHVMKMVLGKEPITDYPKVIEEWRQKGGDKVIKEATERYNNNDGVIKTRR